MAVRITMDPSDAVKVSFSAVDWLAKEGTTLSSYVLSASTGLTVGANSETGGVVTAMVTGTTTGKVTCKFTFADGQIRERSVPVSVFEL